MKCLIFLSCFLFSSSQIVYGLYFGKSLSSEQFDNGFDGTSYHYEPSTSNKTQDGLVTPVSNDFSVNSTTSEFRSEQNYSSTGITPESGSPLTDTEHSQFTDHSTADLKSQSMMTDSSIPSGSQRMENLTEFFNNDTHFNNFTNLSSTSINATSSPPSVMTSEGTPSSKSSTISVKTSKPGRNESSPTPDDDDDETEGVVIGKPIMHANGTTVASTEKTLYQKTMEIISDTYTLSILVPVSAGIICATTILLTIATCRWLRRQCRRKRLRSKVLPESVKNFRQPDRTRLLQESSDEEF